LGGGQGGGKSSEKTGGGNHKRASQEVAWAMRHKGHLSGKINDCRAGSSHIVGKAQRRFALLGVCAIGQENRCRRGENYHGHLAGKISQGKKSRPLERPRCLKRENGQSLWVMRSNHSATKRVDVVKGAGWLVCMGA